MYDVWCIGTPKRPSARPRMLRSSSELFENLTCPHHQSIAISPCQVAFSLPSCQLYHSSVFTYCIALHSCPTPLPRPRPPRLSRSSIVVISSFRIQRCCCTALYCTVHSKFRFSGFSVGKSAHQSLPAVDASLGIQPACKLDERQAQEGDFTAPSQLTAWRCKGAVNSTGAN